MSHQSFESGQVLYTRDGKKVEYIALTPSGNHAVSPVYYTEGDDYHEEGEYAEGVITVVDLFREPPVPVRAADIERLDKEISEKRTLLNGLSAQVRETESERKALAEKLKRHSALRHIDDFIEGRITHFVEKGWDGIRILTKEQGLQNRNRDVDRDLRLLSLFGASKGDLQWRLNIYSDGSGTYTEIYPFLNKEDAVAKAMELINQDIEDCLKVNRPWQLDKPIASAKAIGMPIPEEVARLFSEYQQKSMSEQIAKAEKALADLRAKAAGGAA